MLVDSIGWLLGNTNISKSHEYKIKSEIRKKLKKIIIEIDGKIDRYVGDRVTALFGMEHECDVCTPERCLKCAMNIQTVLKYSMNPYLLSINLPSLTCSIGMDIGQIWIARVGIKGNNEFTLVGPNVNVAAQLVDLAPAKTIFLGQNLHDILPQEQKNYCKEYTDPNWNWTLNGAGYKFYKFDSCWSKYNL